MDENWLTVAPSPPQANDTASSRLIRCSSSSLPAPQSDSHDSRSASRVNAADCSSPVSMDHHHVRQCTDCCGQATTETEQQSAKGRSELLESDMGSKKSATPEIQGPLRSDDESPDKGAALTTLCTGTPLWMVKPASMFNCGNGIQVCTSTKASRIACNRASNIGVIHDNATPAPALLRPSSCRCALEGIYYERSGGGMSESN